MPELSKQDQLEMKVLLVEIKDIMKLIKEENVYFKKVIEQLYKHSKELIDKYSHDR